jgi:hypothetical protein
MAYCSDAHWSEPEPSNVPLTTWAHMKRIRFRLRGFGCPFGCRFLCKTPGGLTRHKYTCSKNPANIYNPPPSTPPSQSPNHSASPSWIPSNTPPCTPGLFHQDLQHLIFPPHTPAPQNNAPIYESPRRIRWTQKGRVNICIHPYLDGELFM